jgi:hypothetical protein
MQATNDVENDRVRLMANSLDCLIEEDFQLLAGATAGTVEAWRKRGQGPSYILLGNRYLYPRKSVAKHLDSITRERASSAKGLL